MENNDDDNCKVISCGNSSTKYSTNRPKPAEGPTGHIAAMVVSIISSSNNSSISIIIVSDGDP